MNGIPVEQLRFTHHGFAHCAIQMALPVAANVLTRAYGQTSLTRERRTQAGLPAHATN